MEVFLRTNAPFKTNVFENEIFETLKPLSQFKKKYIEHTVLGITVIKHKNKIKTLFTVVQIITTLFSKHNITKYTELSM